MRPATFEFQTAHATRMVIRLISVSEEHDIRVVSPDIGGGGGVGNKLGANPGHVCSGVASIVTSTSVKWIRDRVNNLMIAFACGYSMTSTNAATKQGRITGLPHASTADL